MDVIDRINALLTVRGESGAEMSRALGLSNSIYSQWNTRKTKPSARTLSLIAQHLNTTVEYLIAGTGLKEKAPTPEGERPMTFDDFTFAMQNEAKGLTEADKQILLSMARQLNDARERKDGEPG